LGYSPNKKEKSETLMVPFNNKHEKWLYMKEKGLADMFTEIKLVFPDCDEPRIFRKKV